MPVDSVHIQPVAPDPHTGERYGPPQERGHRQRHAPREEARHGHDRLEISDGARTSLLVHWAPPEVEFARRALEKAPALSSDRICQVSDRIDSGYYRLPAVIRRMAARLLPSLR